MLVDALASLLFNDISVVVRENADEWSASLSGFGLFLRNMAGLKCIAGCCFFVFFSHFSFFDVLSRKRFQEPPSKMRGSAKRGELSLFSAPLPAHKACAKNEPPF